MWTNNSRTNRWRQWLVKVIEKSKLDDPNLKAKKHMHVVDLDFVYDSQQTLECIAQENNFNFKDIANLVCDQHPHYNRVP